MPISLLVKRLPEVPADITSLADSLKFRNTILVYLNINSKNLFTDQWLYIHEQSVQMGRITNFRNWVPQLYGNEDTSIICMEYWCDFKDHLWNMESTDLIDLASKEIGITGLVDQTDIMGGHVQRLPRCYPVYFSGYLDKLRPVESYLSSIKNLHVIGRYGSYKYNNQDHSILMGLRAAENIIDKSAHNLWEINTDYEVYQESSVITRTGLITNKV